MKLIPLTLAAACASALVSGNTVAETGKANANAQTCFNITQRIEDKFSGEMLDTSACDLALAAGPHTQQHKASVLFNRALIEKANGDHYAAMRTLESAVNLDTQLVAAKLSHAQLAHYLGDYDTAVAGYLELLEGFSSDLLVKENRERLERNLDRAREALLLVARR